jgi:hypothetical protein
VSAREWQHMEQITYNLRRDRSATASAQGFTAKEADHVQAEGGTGPRECQRGVSQHTEQITYKLRRDRVEGALAWGFAANGERSRSRTG